MLEIAVQSGAVLGDFVAAGQAVRRGAAAAQETFLEAHQALCAPQAQVQVALVNGAHPAAAAPPNVVAATIMNRATIEQFARGVENEEGIAVRIGGYKKARAGRRKGDIQDFRADLACQQVLERGRLASLGHAGAARDWLGGLLGLHPEIGQMRHRLFRASGVAATNVDAVAPAEERVPEVVQEEPAGGRIVGGRTAPQELVEVRQSAVVSRRAKKDHVPIDPGPRAVLVIPVIGRLVLGFVR